MAQAGGPLQDKIRSVFIRFYIVFYFGGKYKYSFSGQEKRTRGKSPGFLCILIQLLNIEEGVAAQVLCDVARGVARSISLASA